MQEFFSARDEPDPEFLHLQREAVSSPQPKYFGAHASPSLYTCAPRSACCCARRDLTHVARFKQREPPTLMPAQFMHVFGKIRHGRMEQVKVRGIYQMHS